MKIIHVVENLNRGGLERVVIDLARSQAAAGHECRIVCVFDAGSLAGELASSGIPVIACNKRRIGGLRLLTRLRQAIGGHRGGVLHTHNATAHYHAVAATLGQRFGAVVSTRHGLGDAGRSSRRERLYRLALRRTDRVVAVSAALRDGFIERWHLPPPLLAVVANGIDVNRFAAASPGARASLRAQLGLPADTVVIGTVGRLNWAKDQASLLRAFALVHAQRPDSALVLVGGGELRDDLGRLADELGIAAGVHFLGDRGDVPDVLGGFDVFAMSSVSEGYSIALLEACASALPIVATDVGGNREIVREGDNGRIVPASDPSALAGALSALLADPEQARSMGGRGRQWVREHGSLDAVAAKYMTIYERAAATRR